MARPVKADKTVSIPLRIPKAWIESLKDISNDIAVSAYSDIMRMAIKKYINEYNEDIALVIAMKETDTNDLVNTDKFLAELKQRKSIL